MATVSPWNSALGMLARREHSAEEIRRKLQQKFPELPEIEIEETLARLQEAGLQSDQRFAEAWLRSQIAKGRGLTRIKMESRGKGIDQELVTAITEAEVDWFELAADVANRRFSFAPVDDKGKAKVFRFLQYRGFSTDQIKAAMDSLPSLESAH